MKKMFSFFKKRFIIRMYLLMAMAVLAPSQSAGAVRTGFLLMPSMQSNSVLASNANTSNNLISTAPFASLSSTRMDSTPDRLTSRFGVGFGLPSGGTDGGILPPDTTVPLPPVAAPPSPGGNASLSQGMISLSFDDGYLSIYQEAVPRLAAAQLKGTFFITTDFLGEVPYMSSNQMVAMYSQGHEIGAHTKTHPHFNNLSPNALRQEIIGSKNDLHNLGVQSVSSFAYPFGEFSDEIVGIVRDAGFSGARTTQGGVNTANIDPYRLKSRNINEGTTMSDVRKWLDMARAGNSWQILSFHRIDQATDDFYNTDPAMFQEIIDYIAAHNIRVVTIAEGVNMLK